MQHAGNKWLQRRAADQTLNTRQATTRRRVGHGDHKWNCNCATGHSPVFFSKILHQILEKFFVAKFGIHTLLPLSCSINLPTTQQQNLSRIVLRCPIRSTNCSTLSKKHATTKLNTSATCSPNASQFGAFYRTPPDLSSPRRLQFFAVVLSFFFVCTVC